MVKNIIESLTYKVFINFNNSKKIKQSAKKLFRDDVLSVLNKSCKCVKCEEFDEKHLVFRIDISLNDGRSPTKLLNTFKKNIKSEFNSKKDAYSGYNIIDITNLDCYCLIPISINTKIKENI